MSTFGVIAVFIGIFLAPVFTLSMVLFWLGHPVLGILALIVSLFRGASAILSS